MLNRLRKLIPRTWRGRLRVIVYGLPVIVLAADLAWVQYLRHIPLSRETTYLTAPLGENGWPDYLGWMNAELKKGVSPEKNAAIPLAQIAGNFSQNDAARKAWLAEAGFTGNPDAMQPQPRRPWLIDFVKHLPPAATQSAAASADAQAILLSEPSAYDAYDRMRRTPWTERDHPLWAAWLRTHDETLAQFHDAVALPQFFDPLVTPDGRTRNAPVSQASPSFHFGPSWLPRGIAMARIMLDLGEGREEMVTQRIEDLLRLSTLQLQTRSNDNQHHGLGGRYVVADFVAHIAGRKELSVAGARRLLAALDDLPPLPPRRDTLEPNRFITLQKLQSLASGGMPQAIDDAPWETDERPGDPPLLRAFPVGRTVLALTRPIHFARLSRQVNQWADRSAALADIADWKAFEDASSRLSREMQAERKAWGAPPLWDIYIQWGDHASHYTRFPQTWENLAKGALALRIFREEHGSYPETLAELSGLVKVESLTDPFMTGPLHYRRQDAGFVLYSAGYDGVDNQGQAPDQNGIARGVDIVVRIPNEVPSRSLWW